jgi:tetratricopeptide (TPR) repeat protein
LDRAIDIKRRAQRCIQGGDLPGALAEYEKLLAADATDPYTYVLLADLLYKMGEHPKAGERYLTAASCYEQAGLYKNAIAVGKKMLRLALSPGTVLERLAALHALDGLPTEASLYYTQSAEHLVRESRVKDAAAALRKAFECCPENVSVLERLAEVHSLADDDAESARALAEAALYYARTGQPAEAERCRARAEHLRPGVVAQFEAQAPPPALGISAGVSADWSAATPEPGMLSSFDSESVAQGPPRLSETTELEPALETGYGTSFDSALDPALEAERPPRFVPPVQESSNGMEIERHTPTMAAGHDGAGAEPPIARTPDAPGSPAPDAADAADLDSVERLLGLAQTEFRAGRHADAAAILARAARAYETLGRLEEAASIHRSLCKSPHATETMMEQWLANCERRGDLSEAASVACELGDLAIQRDDLATAREWFLRAVSHDATNPVATRRLDRLGQGTPAVAAAAAAPIAEPAPVQSDPAGGKVEVAVDRGQAVTFDFASMLAEFQRGVEAQLSGDSQACYDLAMAYREMGLVDQAIESFRLAGKDAQFSQRCAEMVGRCLLEQGRFEDAARELGEALALAAPGSEVVVGVRFELGVALEAAGRTQEALAEFEQVFAIQPNYHDVAVKVRDLRKYLEAA